MQKFNGELKNTPRDTSLVSCSVSSELNKEETLSVQDIVLPLNNPEENQRQPVGEPKATLLVYVLNRDGLPLMPCKPAKARHLLKEKKAKVIHRSPFTIQLTWDCENHIQPVSLGVDTGYQFIGFSVISRDKELLSGELKLENNMSKRLQEKIMYRRNRRNRLWHREPRWKNRRKPKGWLPPSIERRFQTQVKLIEFIKTILPITRLSLEVGSFDIQKIENPDIEGDGYQKGEMYGYRNRIAYLLSRESGKCQYCGKLYKQGDPWRLHHIWGKGKDRPQDWVLVHESCHKKLHRKKEESKLQKRKSKSYKPSIFMSIIRKRFYALYPDADFTYGNITFQDRIDLNLDKSHINDAYVIAGASYQSRVKPFYVEQVKRNNRCLQLNRKGYKPSIRRKKYSLLPKDLVRYKNKIYEVGGVHNYGKYVVLKSKPKNLDVKIEKVSILKYSKGFLTERRIRNSSPA